MHNSYIVSIDSSNRVGGSDEFNAIYSLAQPLHNLTKVELLTVEMPINIYSTRNYYNTFSYSYKGTVTTVSVPSGNYELTDLLTALVTVLNNSLTLAFDVLVDNVKNKISLSVTGATSPVTIVKTLMSVNLGFVGGESGTSNITATNCYVVNNDLYLNIYIKNLPSQSVSNSKSTFKLPINAGSTYIYYFSSVSQMVQSVRVDRSGYTVGFLEIQILDRNGLDLTNNGTNWSLTLRCECE